MTQNLTMYTEAALCARRNAWELAATSLHSAYQAVPPLALSDEECAHLQPYSDDLAIVGQRLPSLTPTLQLFVRFRALLD